MKEHAEFIARAEQLHYWELLSWGQHGCSVVELLSASVEFGELKNFNNENNIEIHSKFLNKNSF